MEFKKKQQPCTDTTLPLSDEHMLSPTHPLFFIYVAHTLMTDENLIMWLM